MLPATREFCGTCGTALTTRAEAFSTQGHVKVGSPSASAGPGLAVFTCDKQAFHQIPSGIPTFDKLPPM